MVSLIYFWVAAGFYEQSGKFWKSLAWPLTLGHLIAAEASKRDFTK